MNIDQLNSSLGVILAEIIGLCVIVFILSRLVHHLGKLLFSVPFLRNIEAGPALLRRNIRLITMLTCFFVTLAAIAGNAFLIYQGREPLQYLLDAQQRLITAEAWLTLGIALAKVLGYFALTLLLVRIIRSRLTQLASKSKGYKGIKANDESVERFFLSLTNLLTRAAWLLFVSFSAAALTAPQGLQDILFVATRVYVIVAIGWILFRALDAIVATLDALVQKYAGEKDLLRYYSQLQELMPVLRRIIEASIYLVVAIFVAKQIEAATTIAAWGIVLLKIAGYFLVCRVAVELINFLIEESLITRATLTTKQEKQRKTFVPLAQNASQYTIYFGFAIAILPLLGVDPTPILAGLGILGLAVSFGAQKLVGDIVAGLFIIFEGQYHVDDEVKLNGNRGKILSVNLRTTHMRNDVGRYEIIKNGDINKVENLCREFILAVIKIPVPYNTDLKKVNQIIINVGEEMRKEPDSRIISPMGLGGIAEFKETCIILGAYCRLSEGGDWVPPGQIRQRIKEAMDEAGIEMPYGHNVISFASNDGTPPLMEKTLSFEDASNA